MNYQPYKKPKYNFLCRVTLENYDYLCRIARQRRISLASLLNSLIAEHRKGGITNQPQSKPHVTNGSCQMSQQL